MLSEDYSLATRDGLRPIVSVLIMSDENLQHYLMCCDDHAAEWTTLTLAIQTLAAPQCSGQHCIPKRALESAERDATQPD